MVNIVFGDSIAGSIKMANYYAKENENIVADLSENLLCFIHNLDYGDISDNGIGDIRVKANNKLFEDYIYNEKIDWADSFRNPKTELEKLRNYIESGETIRFWFGNNAHEVCSFCNILYSIDDMNISNDRILYIKLPKSDVDKNGKQQEYWSSGCFYPEDLLKYMPTQKIITTDERQYYIKQWEKALKLNTSLRIVDDYEIINVSEDYYDDIILNEAKKLDEVFNEPELIGNSLMKIHTTDAFIGKRIEHMISEAIFEVVQPPKKNDVFYKQVIKKGKNF